MIVENHLTCVLLGPHREVDIAVHLLLIVVHGHTQSQVGGVNDFDVVKEARVYLGGNDTPWSLLRQHRSQKESLRR